MKTPTRRWAAIKTGSGRVTGYIEVFQTQSGRWVTIPGVSRFADADGLLACDQNQPLALPAAQPNSQGEIE